MTAWGVNVLRVEDALAKEGPMTGAQLARHLGLKRENLAQTISRMSKKGRKEPKRLYIIRWTHEDEGARRFVRAVYALGDKKDATRPKYDLAALAATRRRYYHKRKKLITGNTVFNLAIPKST
jgi:DNA-binding MarR family transcriptional regulator